MTHYAMFLRSIRRRKEAEEIAVEARFIGKKLTDSQRARWGSRWVGNIDAYEGCGFLLIWGSVLLFTLGIPVALGLIFQSWWALLFVLVIVLPIIATGTLKWLPSIKKGQSPLVRHTLRFLLGVIGGVAGWRLGNLILSGFHLNGWPIPLQFILSVVFALLCFGLLWGGSVLVSNIFLTTPELSLFPKYTLLPALTYTLSLCILPTLLGVSLNSWWVAVGSFVALIALFFILYSARESQVPRWRHLAAIGF
jgi:hypothetical protein